ncbi:MAG: 50S ribosomal protein L24 [Bacteroidia bacterium]|nr:50S ribosomal protein L24 [Bacteroidia bacterium]
MQKKLHIKKGDLVAIITGDFKGRQGKVLNVLRKKNKAIVEGINIITKHSKPTKAHPKGGLLKKEAPVHISNLLLIDPSSGKPTRIGHKLNDKGKVVRYAKKSGEEIK